MTNTILSRVTESTFIGLVLHDDLRRELISFLSGSGDAVRSTAALIGVVESNATPSVTGWCCNVGDCRVEGEKRDAPSLSPSRG